MPIIKSAKKRDKQSKVRQDRNKEYRSTMLSLVKNVIEWAKGGELEKAKSYFDRAQQAVDKALKKGIVKKNKASRQKSQMAKALQSS